MSHASNAGYMRTFFAQASEEGTSVRASGESRSTCLSRVHLIIDTTTSAVAHPSAPHVIDIHTHRQLMILINGQCSASPTPSKTRDLFVFVLVYVIMNLWLR